MAKRVLRAAGRKEEVAGVERRKAREAVLAAEAIMIGTERGDKEVYGCSGKRKVKGVQVQTRREGRNRGICTSPVTFSNVSTTLNQYFGPLVQKLMESQPIKGATYAIASAFRPSPHSGTSYNPQTFTSFTSVVFLTISILCCNSRRLYLLN
jgi:hypothetical protein